MCGLTGFWQLNTESFSQSYEAIALSMAEQIKSRGPDDQGAWADERTGIALGHRRLSIQDLSAAGHQPMHSPCGTYTLVYNGEVYNAPDLRQALLSQGKSFKGHSDTEIILESIVTWGLSRAVSQFVGMFAFALWDHKAEKLYLVRDRLGIKPLYWGLINGCVFFGSQVKSFLPHPQWRGELNHQALVAYFRYNYIPCPLSIYQGIQKQRPGTLLQIDKNGNTQEEYYWNFKEKAPHLAQNRPTISDKEAIATLESLLTDSIDKRMISDVPLGAFLSGGIDSSTVVALMQSLHTKPIKTFSIGFHEDEYNEATHAAEVAKHLKTDHHELYLQSSEAQDIIPHLAHWYDEPFADSSQIPTYLVSKMTRDHVTVALSGDGGDELFTGYNRYALGQSIWSKISPFPLPVRQLLKAGIESVSPTRWTQAAALLPPSCRPQNFGDKLHKLASILTLTSPHHFYKSLVSQWDTPENLVPGAEEPDLWHTESLDSVAFSSNTETMQFMDVMTYLPDDILAKVDRASMAVSLEARVPLLDHRVVEYAWTLPETLKIRDGQTKWILRQILYKHVPKSLIERPKMGFGVPIGAWMRGPLKEWAHALLDPKALEENALNPEPILKRWAEHTSGKRNWQYSLWGVLMYQAWREGQTAGLSK